MPFSANSSLPAESHTDTNIPVAVKPFLTATSTAKSHSGFSRVKWAERQCSCCGINPCFKQRIPFMGTGKKIMAWGCHSPLLSAGPLCDWQCLLCLQCRNEGLIFPSPQEPMQPHTAWPSPVSTHSHIVSIAESCRYSPSASNPFKRPTIWNLKILLYLVFKLPFSSHWNVVITIHLLCKDLQWTMPQWIVPG